MTDSASAIVGWMARCPTTGGRLFAHTELTARLEGQLIYSDHGFTVEPLVVMPGVAQACANPIAWVIPGDDNAKDSGFIDAMAWQQGEFTRPLYAAPPAAAQAQSTEPVQDTWLVGGPDLKAMSGSVESDRVIQLHFRRPATDADRKWLLEAINAKIAADATSVPSTTQREPDDDWEARSERGYINNTVTSKTRGGSDV